MNAILSNAMSSLTSTLTSTSTIDSSELPAFCPLPAPTADDPRLTHLFRASLKLGRIHPLYLPMLKYRNARPGRG